MHGSWPEQLFPKWRNFNMDLYYSLSHAMGIRIVAICKTRRTMRTTPCSSYHRRFSFFALRGSCNFPASASPKNILGPLSKINCKCNTKDSTNTYKNQKTPRATTNIRTARPRKKQHKMQKHDGENYSTKQRLAIMPIGTYSNKNTHSTRVCYKNKVSNNGKKKDSEED